jgi:hypothetical protein
MYEKLELIFREFLEGRIVDNYVLRKIIIMVYRHLT